MSRADPVDEGLIHAWIEGQLSPDEAARVERLVATDAEWGATAAEARGLIAAASRALGALDDVPMVGQAKTGRREDEKPGERRDKRELRAWWRAPWMRAAAGIVLIAGVSSVVWMRGDFDVAREIDAISNESADRAANTPAPVAPPAPTAPPAANDSQSKASLVDPPRGAAQKLAQDEMKALSAISERKETVARQLVSEPPPPTTPRPVAPPPVVEQGVVLGKALMDTGAISRARADSNRVAGAAGGAATPPRDSGAALARDAGARGGRGGRGPGTGVGFGSGVQTNAALEPNAKALSVVTSVDARLRGCWAPVSSLARAEERERAAEGQRESSVLLRFISGVVTDAAAPASAAPTRQAAAGAATRVNAPPVSAFASGLAARAVVNATVVPVARADSAFTAEWIDQRGRNVATFIVRGDTLRGTSRTLPADSARGSAPFVATRAECPQ